MSKKYQHRMSIVEAERFDYDRYKEMSLKYGMRQTHSRDHMERIAWIVTKKGEKAVAHGDWIVRFPDGSMDQMYADEFEAAYEEMT